ncbi:MAG: Spy/CpxP family protein refolding chaperone [Candidatus Electrothrix sp. YB6]
MKARINKKIATAVLAGLIAVSFVPMTANACRGRGGQGQGKGGCAMKGGQNWNQGRGAGMGIWRNTQMIQNLGLSEEQVSKLKEADFTAREKQQALWAEMDSLRLKLDHAFSADTVDEDAVRQLSEKMAAVKGRMVVQRTETRLALRNLLTPEQIDKLSTLRQNRRSAGQGMGQGMGRGNGMKQNCPMNGQGGNGRGNGQGKGMKNGRGNM